MVPNDIYFSQTVLIIMFFYFLWKFKLQNKKAAEKPGILRTSSHLRILKVLHMIFSKPCVVAGQKKSFYPRLYEMFSSNPREPTIWKFFGKTLGVFALDYDTIHTFFKNDAFNDRSHERILGLYSGGKPAGILVNNGKNWEEIKRYTMKKFGQLGLGKKDAMTSILSDLLPDLLERIDSQRQKSGNNIQVRDLFSVSVLNVVLIVLGGKKFAEDDPEFIGMCKGVVDISNFHLGNWFCLGFVSKIWGVREIFGYTHFVNVVNNLSNLLKNFIDERESLGIYKETPEVFLDFFLLEIEKQKSNEDLKDIYSRSQLVTLLQDFIFAGMDTTSKFLESLIMFMCLYPEVQDKLQKEIDSVMGTSASPLYYECKSSMPYTLATINEVLRMTNIVPLVPRMTTKDLVIGNHKIRKGTFVVACTFAVRFDNTYWKDANSFCPERFLDEGGNLLQEKVDRMLYFGTGGRVCPGENIAPAVAFTFGVGFLQKYSVKKAYGSEILGLKDNFGMLNGPDPFHISISER